MVRTYELALILSGKAGEEEQKKTLDELKKALPPPSKIVNTTLLGKKTLSYPIKKEKEGYYFVLALEMEANGVAKFSDKLKLSKFILRHLIISKK